MATPQEWFSAARPRTLPAAIAPVLAGAGAAVPLVGGVQALPVLRVLLCLVISLALQVGVNYANDYSDGIRGTDDDRVGPMRLVGSGAAPAAQVKRAAFLAFGVAGLAGLAVVALAGAWWFIGVGIASVLAAWFYTGGSRPYGYLGLGEVMVFVFFGLVAVTGTTYLAAERVSVATWLVASGVGALACAILVANNLRDIPTDRESGKHTLAVRLGDENTRRLYASLLVIAAICVLGTAITQPWTALALLAFGLAVAPLRTILTGARGPSLIPVLGATGRLELVYAALLALGFCL